MSLCPASCVSSAAMNRFHSVASPGSVSGGGVQRGNVICAFTTTVTSRIEQLDTPIDSVRQLHRMGERVSPTKLLPSIFGPSRCMSAQLLERAAVDVVIEHR